MIKRLKALFGHPDADFDQEMHAHLELLVERYVREGMSPEEAAWAARRQFGNASLLKEARREMSTVSSLETLWRDVRYGARQLRLNPMFTGIAILSLALGIGANTAVFTLLDQLVLRMLPVQAPERLVMIWPAGPPLGSIEGERVTSYPMYQDFQRKAAAFESVFCRYDEPLAVSDGGQTDRVDGELVSGNYFQALGVTPALGRLFSPDADDRVVNGHPVVVLSHAYWVSRFGGDPGIVGRKILVNRYPMEVAGVAAAGFIGLDPTRSPQIWVPILMNSLMTPGENSGRLADRRALWVQVFARMKPGYTVESTNASLQPLFHQILNEEAQSTSLSKAPRYDIDRFLKQPLIVERAAGGFSWMREQYSTALMVLMGMAGLMLLIACSNVASLLIARAVARQKEMAVRLAIGAGRRVLIRQLLVESMLLALSATLLGLVLSATTTRLLLRMLPDSSKLMLRSDPDLRILLFSVAVAVFTGVVFGLAPALQGTKLDLITTLKDVAGPLAGGGRPARLRKALVAVQVALSFLLLVGAGLFARTLMNLKGVHTGFEDVGNVVTFQVDPARLGYDATRVRDLYEGAVREIRSAPGVAAAAYATVPMFHGYNWSGPCTAEGHRVVDGEDLQANRNVISPGYWRAMGIKLLEGRDFDERDRFNGGNADDMPTVAIVNRSFAEHFFGNQSAIGRRIGNVQNGQPKLTTRIVGVVEDSLYEGPRQGVRRTVYYALSEAPVPLAAYFYVRTAQRPDALFPVLRGIMTKLEPSLPVTEMKTLGMQLDEALSTERLIASLSVVFGGLATLLAALGLYGVMAFVVARRTKEIGLRMALGARREWVLWLVMREVVTLLAAGLAAGIPFVFLLSRYVSSQLFGVKAVDGWTCAAAVLVLGVVAAVSGFVPARRAVAIEPLSALRYE